MNGVRSVLLGTAIVVAAFAAYVANGEELAGYDGVPNTLLVRNALATGRLDFDRFRGSYFTALGGQYAFVEAPNGHLSSVFPIGAAIVTAPLEAVLALVERGGPPLTSPAAEPARRHDEKIVAAVVAALAVGLCWACALLLGTPAQAAIVTAIFAVCTPMWAIASQGLWQHGPLNLTLLGMIYALLRAGRAATPGGRARWLAAAGVAAGLLPVVRPTALLFTVAALAFAGATYRGRAGWFAGGAALGVAPGLAWNLAVFHTLGGGYGGDLAAFAADPARATIAFAGLLVSPNRGLFVFAPVLLFAIAGAVRAARSGSAADRLLAALGGACLALTATYAFYHDWWGGFTYGPRFLTDTAAVGSLLLMWVVPRRPLAVLRAAPAVRVGAAAFALAAFASLVIEFAGANGGAAGSEWNAVPVSIDRAPDRVWDLRDSQIRRNLLGAFYRFVPPPPPGPAATDVARIALDSCASSDDDVHVWATVVNVGPTLLYGYRSGRYGGQLRVRVRVTSAAGAVSESPLYVADDVAPGTRRTAYGLVRIPARPATFSLALDPVLVGGAPLRSITRVVRSGGLCA